MKCIVVFLVLSMVVLMAEPGEGFIGALIHGIHSLIKGKQNVAEQQEQQEQLDKRSVDYNPGQPSFA
ncbi:pteroicidin-alpha-like [Siniperca chuatsi]|uniref:pteroicidin-alpha-like n=1 Tax=Siniperca chuatsi TaxID=119488 RepID=UPI001CE1F85A|nr:pteroicidin-alpha-like [Siniperca chuatsi]